MRAVCSRVTVCRNGSLAALDSPRFAGTGFFCLSEPFMTENFTALRKDCKDHYFLKQCLVATHPADIIRALPGPAFLHRILIPALSTPSPRHYCKK